MEGEMGPGAMAGMGILGVLGIVVVLVLSILPFWQLWKRTGHSPWISLLMLVPLLNIIMLFVLAFKSWPIEDRRDRA